METADYAELFAYKDIEGVDDRARLQSFVTDVRSLLEWLVEEGKDRRGHDLFYEDLREPMKEAWKEVQPQFLAVDQLIQGDLGVLQEHGLEGAQLKFKFLTVKKRFQEFWERGGREVLKWLLEAIDNVLDSILDAIGAGSAVKEIKEGIKHAIFE